MTTTPTMGKLWSSSLCLFRSRSPSFSSSESRPYLNRYSASYTLFFPPFSDYLIVISSLYRRLSLFLYILLLLAHTNGATASRVVLPPFIHFFF